MSRPRSQWTATRVWEFRPTINSTPAYAFFVGEADHLANGNVLVDTGGITPVINGVNAQFDEVVPSPSGEGWTSSSKSSCRASSSFIYCGT